MALKGVKVIEIAGLAPAPFCGMLLSDFGAKVIRIDRTSGLNVDTCARGKRSIALNLKKAEGSDIVRRLCSSADVLIEPFRPGVMEKFNLGPQRLLEENPRLIYARMTGFGQKGMLSSRAGHDINYLAISGVLSMLGRKHEKPYPPINLLADFAGGGLSCALGIVMALYERTRSGRGQVIDANMVQGSAYVSSFLWTSQDIGIWDKPRGENMLDTGRHYYETYETSDGQYMSVGAIEPQFYQLLLNGLGLTEEEAPQYGDDYEQLKEKFTKVFKSKTQAEWSEIFENTDACVMPILNKDEARNHPHSRSQDSFLQTPNGQYVPRPAPNLERTPATNKVESNPEIGEHTVNILKEYGYKSSDIKNLLSNGVAVQYTNSKL